jgi:hypothetical protein
MYLPFDILLASTATEICPYSPKCVELDFSHLGGKGIEIRSSPHRTRSADL